MKKIDLHLHLSFDSIPKSDTLLVSSYKEMLPHLEELGIGKGVLMSSGESAFPMPMGSNEENCRIAAADPEHYAWMCNLDYDGNLETVYDRLAACKEKGAVGIGELMINRRLDGAVIEHSPMSKNAVKEFFRLPVVNDLPRIFARRRAESR